jgi:hypothetical protein
MGTHTPLKSDKVNVIEIKMGNCDKRAYTPLCLDTGQRGVKSLKTLLENYVLVSAEVGMKF